MALLDHLPAPVRHRFGHVAQDLQCLLDGAAQRLAPVMPWLYLLVRRAGLASIFWVAALALFTLVPQSREVLRGLVLGQGASSLAPLFYLITSLVMALGLWYAARLLVTVDAALAVPAMWQAGIGLVRLQAATTWLPRLLGSSALAVAMGAWMFALLVPPQGRLASLLVVACALAGPLVVVRVRSLGLPVRPWQRTAGTWAGLALWAGASWRAATWIEPQWHAHVARGLWAAVAPLPSMLLVALVHRRDLLAETTARHRWLPRTRAPRQAAHESREFVQAMQAGLAAGSLVLVALLTLAMMRAESFRTLGSAAVMMLFLALAVQVLTTVLLLTRRLGGHVAGLGAALVALLALYLVVGPGSEPLGDERLPTALEAAAAPAAPASAAGGPLQPQVLINARGGGLRAAVFTADVLARLDDRSCGAFGRRLAGLSGVSGGSLGLATYLVARQALVQEGGWGPGPCPAQPDTSPGPLTRRVRQALLLDHLSPVLGRMATLDILPGTTPTRGQALLDSWNEALRRTQATPATALGLALPLDRLHGGLLVQVPVYFNATDADSGGIVWFSNIPGEPMGRLLPADGARPPARTASVAAPLSVGQAVLHSARFPIVSPAGRVRDATLCDVVEKPWWRHLPGLANDAAGAPICRLVDGGYADNSGVTTLRHRLPGLTSTLLRLDLDGNPPPSGRDPSPSPVPTLLGALLQARGAHADQAAGPGPGVATAVPPLRLGLAPYKTDEVSAPLGWYMSDAAAASLFDAATAAVERVCARGDGLCQPH